MRHPNFLPKNTMKRRVLEKVTFLMFFVLFLLPVNSWCFEVVASNSPLKKLVKEVFPGVKVVQILPPARDFHTYEPTFYQWLAIKSADLAVIVGTEPWAKRVWNLRKGKPTFSLLKKGEVVKDPHLWFDLTRVKKLVLELKDYAIKAFPRNSKQISKRVTKLLKELDLLQKSFNRLSACKYKRFFLLGHPVFDYLLKDSGVKEVTLIKGYQEQEQPGLKSFTKMLQEIKQSGEGIVFITDPQFRDYEDFFKSRGIKVIILWSGGGFPMKGSYIKLLEYNLRQIKKALRCNF